MQLTITEPTFLWIFGLIGLLIVILLAVMVVIAWQVMRLVKFTNAQSSVVGAAIDELRGATHTVSQSLESTSGHLAQFVNVTMSAAGIAKLIGAARSLWQRGRRDDLFDDESPRRRTRSKE